MKRSPEAVPVSIVASLLVCSLLGFGLAAAPAAAQDGTAGTTGLPAMSDDFEADRVDFRITVYENGSAEWLFQYEQGLDTEEDRQNFETFAEEFETNETDLYVNFRDRANALTASGANQTGREMAAANFRRSARVEGPTENLGVVEMSFRWDGFAQVGDRVVMGDVFEGGLYVGVDQRLIVRPGPNLAFADIQPEDGELDEGTLAESSSVTWSGERSFNPSRPRVEFADEDEVSSSDGSAPVGSDTGWMLPVGAFLVVVLLGAGGAVAYRSGALPPSRRDGGAGSGGEGGAAAASSSADDGGAAAGAGGTAAVTDEELISDEERVVGLLEDNGGRMKQVNIVDETGWSKSKVSMLLSEMEDADTISKLRVGRENIVSLAGHEPDAAGSPFDDED